jgi:hypothetical protein
MLLQVPRLDALFLYPSFRRMRSCEEPSFVWLSRLSRNGNPCRIADTVMEYNAGLFHDLVKVGPQRYVAGLPSSGYLEAVRGLVHGPAFRSARFTLRTSPAHR